LLVAGVSVDQVDKFGRTALFTACLEGHENVAELLLKYGADVNLSVFAFLCTKTLCRFFGGFCELLLVEVVADHLSGPDRVIKPVYVCLWVWTISFELNDH